MNIITHRTAFALFPRATFLDRRSLIVNKSGNLHREEARRKYIARGWSMVPIVSAFEATHDMSDFKAGFRHIGDRRTWTIDLTPPVMAQNVSETLTINSWDREYTECHGTVNVHDSVGDRMLKFTYVTIDSDNVRDAWSKVREMLVAEDKLCVVLLLYYVAFH